MIELVGFQRYHIDNLHMLFVGNIIERLGRGDIGGKVCDARVVGGNEGDGERCWGKQWRSRRIWENGWEPGGIGGTNGGHWSRGGPR